MLLANKNAIVYGGAGDVGGAVARAFAREGARVFLAGVPLPLWKLRQPRSAQRVGWQKRPRSMRMIFNPSSSHWMMSSAEQDVLIFRLTPWVTTMCRGNPC